MGGWWEQWRHDPDLVCLPAGGGLGAVPRPAAGALLPLRLGLALGPGAAGGYDGGTNTSELLSTSTMDSADHFPLKYGITA